MNQREKNRKNIIEDLKALIEKGKGWDDERLSLFIMRKYGCSWRTAREYIKVAKS